MKQGNLRLSEFFNLNKDKELEANIRAIAVKNGYCIAYSDKEYESTITAFVEFKRQGATMSTIQLRMQELNDYFSNAFDY